MCVGVRTHTPLHANTQIDIPAVIFHRTPCSREQRRQTEDERMRKKKAESGCENSRRMTGGRAGVEGGEKMSESIEREEGGR